MVFRHSNQFQYGEEIKAAIEREGIDPCRTITLAHIGPMLGGLSSTHFYASGRDEGYRAAEEDSSGPTFSQRVEADADRLYPRALAITRDILDALIAASTKPEALFVADKIWEDKSDYTTHLKRLAQDTSLPVVVPRDYPAVRLLKFDPPVAPSVESYWRNRLTELDTESWPIFPRPEEKSLPTNQEILTALSELLPRNKKSRSRDYNYYRHLHTISEAPANKLEKWLLDPNSIVAEKLEYILGYARFGKLDYIDYASAEPARHILAKINYQPGYEAILQEIEDKAAGTGAKGTSCVPLGIYLQHDPVRADHALETVKETLEKTHAPVHQLYYPLYALLASGDPRISADVASYLRIPVQASEEYGQDVVRPIIEALPQHLAILREGSHQQSLEAIEQAVAHLLGEVVEGEHQNLLERSYLSDPIPEIADILMSFNNSAHHGLLRRTMLTYFAQQGSVVVSKHFARAYIKYRHALGDIPEISQHITIRP